MRLWEADVAMVYEDLPDELQGLFLEEDVAIPEIIRHLICGLVSRPDHGADRRSPFERGLKDAFFTQRFEPSKIGVFEQILAGTIRSAQLQNA